MILKENQIAYRIELDGKYHVDDGTKKFGMQFPDFDSMRAATNPEFELIEVQSGTDPRERELMGAGWDIYGRCPYNGDVDELGNPNSVQVLYKRAKANRLIKKAQIIASEPWPNELMYSVMVQYAS